MKLIIPKWLPACFIIIISMLLFVPSLAQGASSSGTANITEWQVKWGSPSNSAQELEDIRSLEGWLQVDAKHPMPEPPKDISTVWLKVQLPSIHSPNLGVFIPDLYAQSMDVYLEDQKINETHRKYLIDSNKLLLPIHSEDSGKALFFKLDNQNHRFGINKGMVVGDYNELLIEFVKKNLSAFILGGAFIFIAIIMLICSIFLRKPQFSIFPIWMSLCFIILSIGYLLMFDSSYLFSIFSPYGEIFTRLFDISLFVLLCSLLFFFEKLFGPGAFSMIRRFRQFQVLYSAFCVIYMFVNVLSDYKYYKSYFFFSVTVLGYIMILELFLLIGVSILYTIRRNKDAIIFTIGFTFFALTGVGDLILFYLKSQNYEFILWEWGVVGFILSLIVLLGRRMASYYERMINYSKELEIYNHQMQRTEKMGIISELAASVAHEVRNPLQVTRGFLQMFNDKTDGKGREYLALAIEELDRASTIITDFLTFAKPQLEDITEFNVSTELKQIEGIILPLASLNGGEILMDIYPKLIIRGNAAKFKQALINIIKNSIESIQGQGQIQIKAYEDQEQVIIRIQDNGEGMEPRELAKLGEPYFSTKTKGTGLGLMVTFRIIEAMQGEIQFTSKKGVGTEAAIRFPSVSI
jgi:two-component system sporulation sensor kinase B